MNKNNVLVSDLFNADFKQSYILFGCILLLSDIRITIFLIFCIALLVPVALKFQ